MAINDVVCRPLFSDYHRNRLNEIISAILNGVACRKLMHNVNHNAREKHNYQTKTYERVLEVKF